MKELEQLLDYKRRIENSLAGYLDRNRALTRKCLQLRENRKAIDLVHDEVQKELIKELEMIQAIEGLLQRTLEQVEEQIRVCRSADYYLGKELNDKFTAFNIDTKCHQLSNTDAGRAAQRFLGSDKITPNSVTPEDWERFSHDNIQKAERNKNAAQNLRSVVDSVLEQTREDLMKQCAATGWLAIMLRKSSIHPLSFTPLTPPLTPLLPFKGTYLSVSIWPDYPTKF